MVLNSFLTAKGLPTFKMVNVTPPMSFPPPLEFFFQEQSYSSLHSGRSSAWDHVRGDVDDPCGSIADFCGVIADPCGVVAIPEAIGGRAGGRAPMVARLAKHHKALLNIVKHHETHVKHREPLVNHHETPKTL